MIKSIAIESWRQYEKVQITFHANLTIITGANGAGKTTILNIINQHFGWQSNLVATVEQDEETGVIKYMSGFLKKILGSKPLLIGNPRHPMETDRLGEIVYSDGNISNILIPTKTGTQYNLQLSGQRPLHGFNIPSHRPIYKYQNVSTVSLAPITKRAAYDKYRSTQVQRYQGYSGDKSETYFIKETLISLATLGYGNPVLKPNQESIKIYEGFDEILKLVLPPKLGFKKLSIRVPEVILETESGDFSIDAVSGGIASVIDLAWQIYMYDEDTKPFVVVFDEPENHLHPEMQKTLLPNFIKAFPYVQFIVATHNPFIISSVKDSNVYALVYDDNHKVTSKQLNQVDKSGTANEILRQVLGIESTTPDWVDDKVDGILAKYDKVGITEENVGEIKKDLTEAGFGKMANEIIIKKISENND